MPESDGTGWQFAFGSCFDVADEDGVGEAYESEQGEGEVVDACVGDGDSAEDSHIGKPVECAVEDSAEGGFEISESSERAVEHVHGGSEDKEYAGIKWGWGYFGAVPGLFAANGEEPGTDEGEDRACDGKHVWCQSGADEDF